MIKQEFLVLCDRVFRDCGFIKKGKSYYLDLNSDIIGSIHFQQSDYGKAFYLNCGFSLKNCNEHLPYPKRSETNMDWRIAVPGREKLAGKAKDYVYSTEMIKYTLYDPDEMEAYLKRELEAWVLPAIKNGMAYILQHDELYRVMLKIAKILHKIPG